MTLKKMKKKNANGCERNFNEDFPKNCLGELSNSSSKRRTHDCFGELPSNSPRKVVQYILPKLGSMFSRTKIFSFENCIFLTSGLGMCKRVGEDSRHGIGHVDIQVGSCICLSVVAITCALRWGVMHIGDYHYWALLTLSRDHYFRYRECSGGRRSLETALRRKPTCGFGIHFV